AGQNPVKLAWITLIPAKALRASHQGWTRSDSAMPSNTTKPAKAITARSSVIIHAPSLLAARPETQLADTHHVQGEPLVEGLALAFPHLSQEVLFEPDLGEVDPLAL